VQVDGVGRDGQTEKCFGKEKRMGSRGAGCAGSLYPDGGQQNRGHSAQDGNDPHSVGLKSWGSQKWEYWHLVEEPARLPFTHGASVAYRLVNVWHITFISQRPRPVSASQIGGINRRICALLGIYVPIPGGV
jgi:hypothetical protein